MVGYARNSPWVVGRISRQCVNWMPRRPFDNTHVKGPVRRTGPTTGADMSSDSTDASRRDFLKTAAVGAVVSAAPAILNAEDKAGTKNPIIGEGDHTYESIHGLGILPEIIQWGETHGVAIDEAGFVF